LQAPGPDEPGQTLFTGLLADPERNRRADHRAGRREERVEPEELGLARGHQNDDEVDAQGKEEHHRSIENAREHNARRDQEVSEHREEERTHYRRSQANRTPFTAHSAAYAGGG